MPPHLTLEQLESGIPWIEQSPKDGGWLRAIVVRPATDDRRVLEEGELSGEGGVLGDNWLSSCAVRLPDGRPDPAMQVAIMNARAIAVIAENVASDRVFDDPHGTWSLAGDNLFLDLDLSEQNLPVGQRLRIGKAELEVTAVPHNGCHKFAQRYGAEAVRFVNSQVGKQLHLRGIYARVVTPGQVRVGDQVQKY